MKPSPLFACAALASVALHLGVLGWAGARDARPEIGAPQRPLAAAIDARIVRVDHPVPLAAASFSGTPIAAAVPRPARQAPAASIGTIATTTTTMPPPTASADTDRPAADEPPQSATTRFYSFSEVEVPAAPRDDWPLDAATLDGAHIGRLVFELFVDDVGQVVDCAIVDPPGLDSALRESIEARIRTTVLLPAMRAGQAVDSVRRIELTVS